VAGIVVSASDGLDTPRCGSLITCLTTMALTYRETHGETFVTCVAVPLVAMVVVVVMGMPSR
jgi:hypothetical protein